MARLAFFPWRRLLIAAVPVVLLTFYLTQVAPALVPVEPGVKVPFPALTHLLEGVGAWCGQNVTLVFGAGGVLLLAGLLFRISASRYYLHLTIVAAALLTVSYLSISAPIDRLLRTVEKGIPRDQRVPDFKESPPTHE